MASAGAARVPSVWNLDDYLNVVVGLLQLTLAVVVARHVVRFGRTFPWLVALVVFFGVRGLDRVAVAVAGEELSLVNLLTDAVLVVALVLLIVRLEETVRRLALAENEAAVRAEEYERALADYRVLIRHRLANPLAAIAGSALTLKERELDDDLQRRLLDTIEREAKAIETLAVEPMPLGAEEHTLAPAPRPRRSPGSGAA